jgi:hypothetical protein
MKAAIEMAVHAKPPLIKPPQPDPLNLPGELVATVVTNYVNAQARKPAPKQAAPRKPPPIKRGGNARQRFLLRRRLVWGRTVVLPHFLCS